MVVDVFCETSLKYINIQRNSWPSPGPRQNVQILNLWVQVLSLMPLNVKESLLLPPTLFVLILLFLAKQKGAFGLRTGVSIGCVGPRAEVEVSCNSARNIRASRTRHSSTISCSNSSGWKNDVIMKCVELDKKNNC